MQSKLDSGPPLLPRQTAPLPSRLWPRRRLSPILRDGLQGAGYHFSKGYGRDDGDG